MLKSNSKQARENIREYILNHFDPSNYELEKNPETFPEIAKFILDTFQAEKYYTLQYMKKAGISEQEAFTDWAAGLPSVLDTCYYYNRSAVNDLAAILEETDAEKARFTESQAEKQLTYLIYRELLRGAKQ